MITNNIWLGTWTLGGMGFGPNPNKSPHSIILKAISNGITCFDTAGVYAKGQSECILANALRTVSRSDVFISSKGGLYWDGNNVLHDASPSSLRQACYESLDRLKTDYLDLYSLHWPDPSVSVVDSVNELLSLYHEGVIRHIGVCNFTIDELSQIKALDLDCVVFHQVHHNMMHRSDSILTYARHIKNIINVAYSPVEQGLLVRKPRHINSDATFAKLFRVSSLNPFYDAMSWVLNDDLVDVVISGSRTLSQLNELCRLIK